MINFREPLLRGEPLLSSIISGKKEDADFGNIAQVSDSRVDREKT